MKKDQSTLPCCREEARLLTQAAKAEEKRLKRAQKLSIRDKSVFDVIYITYPATKGWRQTTATRNWNKQVHEACNHACMLTGISKAVSRPGINRSKIEAHHVYGGDEFATLRVDPRNGVLLYYKIHAAYHESLTMVLSTIYGFQPWKYSLPFASLKPQRGLVIPILCWSLLINYCQILLDIWPKAICTIVLSLTLKPQSGLLAQAPQYNNTGIMIKLKSKKP